MLNCKLYSIALGSMAFFLTLLLGKPAVATNIFMEKAILHIRPDIKQKQRAPPDALHTIVIARKQKNMDVLEKVLNEVSYPDSPKYGQHWTKQQIAELTANPSASTFITSFLAEHGANIIKRTLYDDYITAVAPIHKWEELFSTEFYEFEHDMLVGQKLLRAHHYSLPVDLAEHVDAVFNTVQFPDHHAGQKLKYEKKFTSHIRTTAANTVTPTVLNSLYDIVNNTGSQRASQAIYAILEQTMSPTDLTAFQDYFSIPNEAIAADVGGHVSNDACAADINDCLEANLDIQWIMAVARNVPTTFYYWTGSDIWLDWIETVADLSDPPQVWSISYGSYETSISTAYLTSFSTEAIKLGVAGVTLVAASGDDGVAGFLARDGTVSCGYYPMFPASNPYVLSVGGTMGPESSSTEVACQSDGGSSITTGGGFSGTYAQPSYQTDVVTDYFSTVSTSPVSGYDSSKRGFPDVALLANRYIVFADGSSTIVSGTSASSPVMAGMVALVNSHRILAGNSTLGWLNPTLYSTYSSYVNDITSGDNKCLASGYGCCTQGFYCSTGWDPVTGLGSIDFDSFLLALANVDISNSGSSSSSSSSGSGDDLFGLPFSLAVTIIAIIVLLAIVVCACFACCSKPQYQAALTSAPSDGRSPQASTEMVSRI